MRRTLIAILAGFALVGCLDRSGTDWLRQSRKPGLEIFPDRASPIPEVPFHLTIRGRWPAQVTAEEPPYPSYITNLVVRDYRRVLTEEAGWNLLTVDLTVEAAIEGVYRVPSIPVILHDGTREKIIRTLPLFLDIAYEPARGVTEIRPLKPLQPIDRPGLSWWWLASLPLLGAAVWLILRQRHRAKQEIPPFERFRIELKKLTDSLGDQLLERESSYRLSYLIRQLIEDVTGINALEMTAQELHRGIKTLPPHQEEPARRLAAIALELETIKYRPDGRGMRTVIQVANEIINPARELTAPPPETSERKEEA